MKTAIVLPDQHFPLHDQKACDVVLQAIEVIKPDIFINLGDVGEWESVSHWKWKRQKRPPLNYQVPIINADIESVNNEIDKFDKVLDKVGCEERYILTGNHDEWLDMFVDENPIIEAFNIKDYTFRNACRWAERGYKYYNYNSPLRIGKLSFIHGAYTTKYHAWRHLETYGVNIGYAHCHDIQRHTSTKLSSGTIAAWSFGCVKDGAADKNKWLRGRLHNWGHAFGEVNWFSNGDFNVKVHEIVNGKTILRGKEINVN